jgi:ABC-2 type transport system permease protein
MYRAFFISALQTQLAYRGQAWASIFGDLVEVFARIAIWMSIFAVAGDKAGGVSLKEMITYTIVGSVLLGAWEWRLYLNVIGQQIKTGDVAVFLLKPLNYLLMMLFWELGTIAFRLMAVVLPVIVVTGLIYGVEPPASPFHGAMFVGFLLLGFVILFLLATIAGLLAFWMMTVFALEWSMHAFMAVLAGSFVPLWFFPAPAAAIIERLPFAYTTFHPNAVYLGRLDVNATLTTFGIGCGWAVVLTGFAAWLWSLAQHRIVVQGG